MADLKISSNGKYTVDPLYQWDLNQTLTIYGLSLPSVPEIHFTNANMGKAIVRQSTMDSAGIITVKIPNSLLQVAIPLLVYVCIYEDGEFNSLYSMSIPVKARKKPEDYTFVDDEEVYSFNELENLVHNTVYNLNAQYEAFKKEVHGIVDYTEITDEELQTIYNEIYR